MDKIKKIKYFINRYPNLQKIFVNITWLSGDKIVRMGFGLVVGVWVARYLGPDNYGALNYAIAFISLFSSFASLGLDGIVIRELVAKEDKKYEILGTAFFLKLIAGILCIAIVMISVCFLRKGDILSQVLVLITAMGFIAQSLDVIDFWFQSRIMSKYTVLAKNTAFILASVIKVILIVTKANVIAFALVGILETFLGAFNLIVAYKMDKYSFKKWRFKFSLAKEFLKNSWPLILSGVAIMTYMRIDQIMVREMLSERATGYYAAAVKIAEIWYFIPVGIGASVYPSILNSKKVSYEAFNNKLQILYELMAIISIAFAFLISVFSGTITNLLYGNEYIQSASVLAIYVWAGVPVSLGVASGYYLLAENYTKISFATTCAGCVTNILLNIILIPKIGLNGAAWATFISYFISTFAIIVFKKTNKQGINLLKSIIPLKIFSYLKRYIDTRIEHT